MSSLEIAELTGKEHRNVMADIRKMFEELGQAAADFSATAFYQVNNATREREVFNLPKRESLILVSGYSTVLRARIIGRWQHLKMTGHQPLSNSHQWWKSKPSANAALRHHRHISLRQTKVVNGKVILVFDKTGEKAVT